MATGTIEMDSLQRAFNLFILGLPSNDLESLLTSLRDDGSRTGFETEFLRLTNEVLTTVSTKEAPGSPNSSDRNTGSSSSKKSTDKKLRPLNSFIAYRSFYSAIFPDITQKTKSGIIKDLWQADPYKAKWAILAKVYSTLRDDHGRNVTLETFLNLTVPFIGLIQPNEYLAAMGCRVAFTDEQNYIIETISSPRTDISEATNYSVADVVDFCYTTGYVHADGTQHANQSATTSQLSFAAHSNGNIRTDQAAIVLDNVNRVMPHNGQIVATQTQATTSELLRVRYPMQTQDEMVENIRAKIEELSQYNGGDPDMYAVFNPAVQGFPVYDPFAHDPFDAYDITEMPL
ncbi:Mating-type protein MAT-1, putative [Talaromyces stipitatus ATCC 10500]|uniref:Mating-type protein MAT-1, putative n=1 Tax=Talaromyces stipitatus (strain ATCC 10500 / CBS 375.48 / QM 6759 / NRRL 1006) TaxID=441959 RepID=B8MMU0_TALSN|nr:Mating-type protein MAT-1, putative [Talaromyces stipitatus ATCC 10500]EED13846.1 Mating-type protein MAT-1, putative [Talaromyces stipitatus ATCC 10500]